MNQDTNLQNCLPYLKEVRSQISIQEIIEYFNEHDIEYSHMKDIDMYIHYIEFHLDKTSKKDADVTDVLFLLEPTEEGEKVVFAYFPKMFYNKELYKSTFTGYAHIGQHTAIHSDYANECKQATEKEYTDLRKELESIGYNLNILNK